MTLADILGTAAIFATVLTLVGTYIYCANRIDRDAEERRRKTLNQGA